MGVMVGDINIQRQMVKIAYIHAMSFPSAEANTFDAIWTASALAERVDTTFFMPRLKTSFTELKQHYEIPETKLQFQPMYLNYIPDRFLIWFKNWYNQLIIYYLRFHPGWVAFQGQKILYVREPKELLFWGLQRERQDWLKDWIFCYEAHDHLGFTPDQFNKIDPLDPESDFEGKNPRLTIHSLHQFDFLICNTHALADDLHTWAGNSVSTHVIKLASPLPRLPNPPKIHSFGEKIILGYIGTINQLRGVHLLLDAMRFLPQNYYLRMVGRFEQEKNIDPNWLDKYRADPQISARLEVNIGPIRAVAAEIDRCDILIQPASNNVYDSRYVSPLKSFSYMVRGKPIVAADVPCHHELYQEGTTAVLYPLDPKRLAHCIINLVNHPDLAERIARGAWEQAADYNLARRADEILSLTEDFYMKRQASNE